MAETSVLPYPNLPPGYRLVLSWKLSGSMSRLVIMQILMVPALFLSCSLFGSLAAVDSSQGFRLNIDFSTWLMLLVGSILVLIIHELVHGVAIKAFGAPPKFGVLPKAGAIYATADGFAFRRNQYLVIALAPLVVISLVAAGLILLTRGSQLALILAVSAAINAAGAIGDLWITLITLRFPASAYVVDEKDGMKIFLPPEAGPASA